MCQIALIILGILGLCNAISVTGLSIGVLITVGLQILFDVVVKILEKS